MWDFITNEEAIHAALLTILLSVGVVTPLLIWRAKLNLEKESRAFSCCKKKIDDLKRNIKKSEDPYLALMKRAQDNPMNSSVAVQQFIYVGESADIKELRSGYASDRLYAVLASVRTKNLVRKTPDLKDLHEFTIQRERGGGATAAFRTLSPSILVLGILGTLLGVHNSLDDVSNGAGIVALSDALVPGALAVFFTVLVMLFRGFYNRKFSEFISEFDEYTLNTLLVFFQPESQDNVDARKLHHVLQEVKNGKQTMEKLLYGVKMFHDIACESEKDCADLLLKTQENLGNMGLLFDTSYKHLELLNKLREVVIRTFSAQLNVRRICAEQLKYIQAWLNTAENAFCRIYEELGYRGMNYIHDMPVWKNDLRELKRGILLLSKSVESGFSMPHISESLSWFQYLNAALAYLPEYVRQYKENEGAINTADDTIDARIADMARMENDARLLHGRITEQFNIVMQDSAAFYAAYRDLHQKVIATLNEYQLKVERMPKGGGRVYDAGVQGLLQRIKDRMMKFRLFYRKPSGIAVVVLIVVVLVAWNILIQL